MSLISIATLVVMIILSVGMVLGFFRGWKRSVVRFGIILASLLISIIFAPIISSFIIKRFVSGTSINILSFSFNLEEFVGGFVGENVDIAEFFAQGSMTSNLINSITNIIMNMILFVSMFVMINVLSLIIYWIVLLVLKVKMRDDEESENLKAKAKDDDEKDGKYWGLKFLGAFIGIAGALVICFSILTPMFGMMNILNGLVAESSTEKKTASANNYNSFICGNLYYTEDKNIGKIEGYIEQYAEIKRLYDNSFLGKFLKYTGLKKAGIATFNRLTTVRQGSLRINFSDELVDIVVVYNEYKELFVKNNFDISNNENIDELVALYDRAIESEIIKGYIIEIVPKASLKWGKGEKYLGIEYPVKGDYAEVVQSALPVFNVSNINRTTQNFKAITNAIKVANNYGFVDAINEKQKVEDILSNTDGFVKEEILVLSSTTELRENVSNILNETFEMLYKNIVGKDLEFSENELSLKEIAEINVNKGWTKEAENIENTVSELLDVYDVIKNNSNSEALLDSLDKVGYAIDYSRKSKLISNPFKTFISGFIDEKVNLEEGVKTEILNNIQTNWNDGGYSFGEMFKTVQETAKVAKDISDNKENVSLEGVKDSLKDMISNESQKDSIANMLESNVIKDMVGEENQDTANVLTDILGTLVSSDKVKDDTLDNDIKAGEQIVNIVTNVKNNEGNLNLGETESEKEQSADKLVSDLKSSEAMMELLSDSANSEEGSAITDFTKDVSETDKLVILNSIDKLDDSDPDKEILKKLFQIA